MRAAQTERTPPWHGGITVFRRFQGCNRWVPLRIGVRLIDLSDWYVDVYVKYCSFVWQVVIEERGAPAFELALAPGNQITSIRPSHDRQSKAVVTVKE